MDNTKRKKYKKKYFKKIFKKNILKKYLKKNKNNKDFWQKVIIHSENNVIVGVFIKTPKNQKIQKSWKVKCFYIH